MRTVLDNGLTVVLREDHAARVAALQLWVRVGSADEALDEAGLAHLHEHMLFKGTERRGPGEIARAVESRGGNINAWTSFDQTVYHLVIASDFFGEGVDILADAVSHSTFDPTELSREIEVVCEEIRRGDDSPGRRISRALFGTAFQTHPYGRPVIGSEASVRSFTRDKILGFYHRHYTTRNMVMVAVGDFDQAAALEAIGEAFAETRSHARVRLATRVVELPQEALRLHVETAPIHEAHLSLAWHIPGAAAEDVAALDLLASVLGQGDASRLTLEVKRERSLVNAIHASAYTPQDPGLMIIGSTLPVDNIPGALSETLKQTYRFRREEVTPGEMRRAKRLIESDAIYLRETVQGRARRAGYFETALGHIDREAEYLNAIAAASPADLRKAAERYLRSDALSVAMLLPQGESAPIDEATVRRIADEAEAHLRQELVTHPVRPYVRLSADDGIASPRDRAAFATSTLPCGARLVVKEDRTVPIVAIRAAWLGGLRAETAEVNGINSLMGRMLLRGTENRSARMLAEEVDDLAASMGGAAGRNSYGARAEFLSADTEHAFELFADVLLHPAFEAAELDKERALVLEDIKSRDDSPASAAFSLFASTLYDHHPYRMEMQGTEASVHALTPDALRRYWRENYRLEDLTLSVAGDVTPERAQLLAERHLTGAKRATASPRPDIAEPPLSGPREATRQLDRKQAHLIVGFRGTTIASADRYALSVLASVLSGQGGRLFLELRDKRSLAYSVSCILSEGIDPGWIGVYIGTSPEKVPEAQVGIRRELERIASERVSDAEMDRTRRLLIGSHEIGLQRLSARAGVVALDVTYGLGVENHLRFAEAIRSVTADDVLAAAQKYFDFNRSVTALVAPKV